MPRQAVKRFSRQVISRSGTMSGNVVTKGGSPYLYLDFTRAGIRTEISTKLLDNDANRERAITVLAATLAQIEAGEFQFAWTFPYASRRLLELHSRLENAPFMVDSERMTFADYVGRSGGAKGSWRARIVAKYPRLSRRVDYNSAIDSRLLPFFGGLTFHQITGVKVEEFILSLVHLKGSKQGQTLSGSRIRNLLTVLDVILASARSEHHLDIPDPIEYIRQAQKKRRQIIPPRKKHPPQVFRFQTWQKLVAAMPAFFRPIAELFLLTGMIASEVAGLRKADIDDHYIRVRNKVAREEKEDLKNDFRIRDIPITAALRRVLNILMDRSDCKYVVTMPDGGRYSHTRFYGVWCSAFNDTGVSYFRPYAMRHTFAAWAMSLGLDINKLEHLMGHGSKQMLFEIYGKYVQGLEDDKNSILGFMGTDFLQREPQGKPGSYQSERAGLEQHLPEQEKDYPFRGVTFAQFSNSFRHPGSDFSPRWQ
ncbi:tyrosine-type recombinase/integrase [Geomonas paludis]|uniref:Tyrosine-type recombinase/integrase n=1 Tax=Geomonas paludis TaxID=2740185 RepID=A0ABY4LI92_9BACT|nr:tyrosine-type recombinase/integrase [Geomonas paludis]UPU37474.1 tyrosine-type recombinase/integrase [Geomonas paludis]